MWQRLIGWVRKIPTRRDRDTSRESAGDAVGALANGEVDARIRIAREQLRRVGAFEDAESIPMRLLTDAQLDCRIRMVEAELRKLRADAGVVAAPSRSEVLAVVCQIEALDYLIEHPDASIAPLDALDGIEDEASRWAAFLSGLDAGPEAWE